MHFQAKGIFEKQSAPQYQNTQVLNTKTSHSSVSTLFKELFKVD
jgi:hypothetical protein